MNTTPWTMPTTLQLELLTALTVEPRRWVRLAFPAKVSYSRRPVEDVFESDTSRLFITRRASDALDLSLSLDSGQLTMAQMMALEEIRRVNAPVYVYPRWPGTTQYLWPLRRNVKGDPADATHACTLADGTTVYALRESASRGAFLEEIDPSNPVVQPGVYLSEHIEGSFPLGQGVAIIKPRLNEVKNSLFGYVTANVPESWTATAGTPGTDMGVLTDSWIGVPALWMWGQTAKWTSAPIVLTANTSMGIMFGWKCDGVLKVTLNYDSGTDVVYSLGPGAGFARYQVSIPATASSATIVVQGGSGMTYAEFSAPQMITGATKNDGNSFFFGGSGDKGAVTAFTARATGLDIEPHLQEGAATGVPDGYGIIAVSGYVQPMWEENVGEAYGIVTLYNSRTSHHTCCAFEKAPSDLGMFMKVYEDGAVKGTQSVSHTRGDTYAFVFYSGRKNVLGSPTEILGCQFAKVGTPGTVYTCETSTSIQPYLCFDQVWIGEAVVTDETNCQLDGIAGGYAVHSIRYEDISSMVAQMANTDYTDLWRNTLGRQYRLLPNLSPSPWQRTYWGGAGTSPSIELTQYREL